MSSPARNRETRPTSRSSAASRPRRWATARRTRRAGAAHRRSTTKANRAPTKMTAAASSSPRNHNGGSNTQEAPPSTASAANPSKIFSRPSPARAVLRCDSGWPLPTGTPGHVPGPGRQDQVQEVPQAQGPEACPEAGPGTGGENSAPPPGAEYQRPEPRGCRRHEPVRAEPREVAQVDPRSIRRTTSMSNPTLISSPSAATSGD